MHHSARRRSKESDVYSLSVVAGMRPPDCSWRAILSNVPRIPAFLLNNSGLRVGDVARNLGSLSSSSCRRVTASRTLRDGDNVRVICINDCKESPHDIGRILVSPSAAREIALVRARVKREISCGRRNSREQCALTDLFARYRRRNEFNRDTLRKRVDTKTAMLQSPSALQYSRGGRDFLLLTSARSDLASERGDLGIWITSGATQHCH